MPRLDLPSGAWVEYRDLDDLMADDQYAVHKAVEFRSTGRTPGEMVQFSSGATLDDMRYALLERVITAWSLSEKGIPIPSENLDGAAAIRKNLKIRDVNALAEAVEPMMQEVAFTVPNRKKSSA